MTAAIGLYQRLRLPEPWRVATTPIPLLIYGGSTAVGSFAIKLAQASNIHPLIIVAGRGTQYVETLINRSKGDTIIDYRNGDKKVLEGVQDALKKNGLESVQYALDTVSEKGSYQNICELLTPDSGHITMVLPPKDAASEIPQGITQTLTAVGSAHEAVDSESTEGKQGVVTGNREYAFIWHRLFARGLQEGWFSSHPYEIVPGGLGSVEKGLKDYREGKNSAVKYVFRIADTEGVE